jgi:hypothetical protein
MFAHLVSTYHLHPIVDHFTIALLTFGIAAEILAAAAIPLSRDRPGFVSVWGQKLRSTALFLMIGGAAASVLSYFTGDEEADRLWDTMSPAAQEILLSSNGPDYLSHAILGHRLMYAFPNTRWITHALHISTDRKHLSLYYTGLNNISPDATQGRTPRWHAPL